MLKGRFLHISLAGIFFVSVLYFVWANILILDDLSDPYGDIQDLAAALEQNHGESPDNEETENYISQHYADSAEIGGISSIIPPKGYHIHINLDERIMYVYRNGGLLYTYPVSGGKSSSPSPLGNWKVISKDTWGKGFGGVWLGLNVPWGKYGIHGTKFPWFIGKSNESKGCIRMLNKDAKQLYETIPHGTTVSIVQNNHPFRDMKNGDIGSDIREMQKALKHLGYYHGGLDGKFGTGLKQSVIKFQKANNIKVTGIIGKITYSAIMQKVKDKDSE